MAKYLYCPSCGERIYEMTREVAKGDPVKASDFKECRSDAPAPKSGDVVRCPLCKVSLCKPGHLSLDDIHE